MTDNKFTEEKQFVKKLQIKIAEYSDSTQFFSIRSLKYNEPGGWQLNTDFEEVRSLINRGFDEFEKLKMSE